MHCLKHAVFLCSRNLFLMRFYLPSLSYCSAIPVCGKVRRLFLLMCCELNLTVMLVQIKKRNHCDNCQAMCLSTLEICALLLAVRSSAQFLLAEDCTSFTLLFKASIVDVCLWLRIRKKKKQHASFYTFIAYPYFSFSVSALFLWNNVSFKLLCDTKKLYFEAFF